MYCFPEELVLLIRVIEGQGPTVLAVDIGKGCLDIFSLVCHISLLSPYLWEMTRYRLKYCLNTEILTVKPNQPTNVNLETCSEATRSRTSDLCLQL